MNDLHWSYVSAEEVAANSLCERLKKIPVSSVMVKIKRRFVLSSCNAFSFDHPSTKIWETGHDNHEETDEIHDVHSRKPTFVTKTYAQSKTQQNSTIDLMEQMEQTHQ